jgi:hypothetical protein
MKQGIKVQEEDYKSINLLKNKFQSEWNYKILEKKRMLFCSSSYFCLIPQVI